jgi:hypothetical protein
MAAAINYLRKVGETHNTIGIHISVGKLLNSIDLVIDIWENLHYIYIWENDLIKAHNIYYDLIKAHNIYYVV